MVNSVLTYGSTIDILRQVQRKEEQHIQTIADEVRKITKRFSYNKRDNEARLCISWLSDCYFNEKREGSYRVRNWKIWLATESILAYATLISTYLIPGVGGVRFVFAFPMMSGTFPAADLISRKLEDILESIINHFYQKDSRKTIDKIDHLIKKRLNRYDDRDSVNPNVIAAQLGELKIPSYFRHAILNELSISQLIQLKKAMGDEAWNRFAEGWNISKNTKFCLKFFEEIHSPEFHTLSALTQLTPRLKSNFPLFKEIIKAMNTDQLLDSSKVERFLSSIWKELETPYHNLSYQEFVHRTKQDHEVQIQVTSTSDYQVISVPARINQLLDYKAFEQMISSDTEEVINVKDLTSLTLSFNDPAVADVFPSLIEFIENGYTSIDRQNVIPLVQLADECGIDDCTRFCYRYLLKHRNKFEEIDDADFLRLLCSISIVQHVSKACVLAAVRDSLSEDPIDATRLTELLEVALEFGLKGSLQYADQFLAKGLYKSDEELYQLVRANPSSFPQTGKLTEVEVKCGEEVGVIPARMNALMKYDVFVEQLNHQDTEGVQDSLMVSIPEFSHAEVFHLLIEFIESGDCESLDTETVIPLIQLANQLEIHYCTQFCHDYLVKHKEKFNDEKAYFDLLFSIPINKDQNEQLLLESIREYLVYNMNLHKFISLAEVALKYNLREIIEFTDNYLHRMKFGLTKKFLDLLWSNSTFFPKTCESVRKTIKNYTPEDFNRDLIKLLNDIVNIEELITVVESTLKEHFPIEDFRRLWEFAIKHGRKNLKATCLDILKNSDDTKKETITNQWPLGDLPHDLILVIRTLIEPKE